MGESSLNKTTTPIQHPRNQQDLTEVDEEIVVRSEEAQETLSTDEDEETNSANLRTHSTRTGARHSNRNTNSTASTNSSELGMSSSPFLNIEMFRKFVFCHIDFLRKLSNEVKSEPNETLKMLFLMMMTKTKMKKETPTSLRKMEYRLELDIQNNYIQRLLDMFLT